MRYRLSPWFPSKSLALKWAAAVLAPLSFAGVAHAQSLGAIEQRLRQVEQKVALLETGGSARGAASTASDQSVSIDALMQLDRRLAALERALSGLISAQEQDHRALVTGMAQVQTMKGDTEARLDAVERQAAVPAPPPASIPQPVATAAQPLSADDRFGQAMLYAERQDWPRAELAFDSFVAAWPADPRASEARFQLGRAFQGQGKHAQAAQLFLELYEKAPNAPFIIDDLFALGQALTDMGPANSAQACDVYAEIETTHGAALTLEQRSQLLDRRLALKCPG
ncbi:hypothetical protein EBBID32_23170 [Sphingobium indicum BiD32]|uniref:Cell division coordinator CpoB n=1 Tax=Sphingobium indicum BiD32 TaxID=1301087 RepID=N1MQL1_9SPHN|nr:tetratricopeptide repeat protein [Sphingobium indicum]CCW17967.1 hypothetical protein EBBID32_23170 [Sphingobium indicum BiD32]